MVHWLSDAASGLSSTCSPAGGCIQQTSSDKLTVRFHPSAKQDAHEVKPDTCLRNWIRTKLELRESDYYYQGNSCEFEIPSESVFYSHCIYRHYPPDVISRICVMWEVSVLHKQQCWYNVLPLPACVTSTHTHLQLIQIEQQMLCGCAGIRQPVVAPNFAVITLNINLAALAAQLLCAVQHIMNPDQIFVAMPICAGWLLLRHLCVFGAVWSITGGRVFTLQIADMADLHGIKIKDDYYKLPAVPR